MSYANPEDEWFPYTDDFNKTPESPGAANQFNFEAGNIDNIPLNDDGPLSPGANLEFDLGANLDDYQFGDTLRLSPNNGSNGQQPGTSGQYQNMHLMQSNDTFDQHMQPSTSVAYNSFEMPTVVNSNLDVGPYQDLGIDDPNSFYARQQPSTSMANDMNMSDSYEMMGQSTSTYIPQIDQLAGPSSVSNQSQPMQQDVMQAAPKPKSKKRQPPKKKPNGAVETVGTALTKANKFSQQVENAGVEGGSEGKVEAKLSAEDSMQVGTLLHQVQELRKAQENGNTDPQLATRIDELQSRIVLLFSKSGGATAAIVSTLQRSTNPEQAPPPNATTVPKKSSSSKKRSNHQKTVQQSQPQNVQQQPQQKLMMDPPTTTLVPSGSGYNGDSSENYVMYQPMDQQGTSQQQYVEYQQPGSQEQMQMQQPIQAKVVPSMNSRTHTYRQTVVFNSQTANVTPSPHQVEQLPDQYQEGSQQMYVPQNQQQLDDRPMYQPQHQPDSERTLGDVLRQTHGRYQGPQDAPNLRQQLLTNVNATGKQIHQNSTPTPSPGNLHNNNTMQYGEMQQHSYPQSLEPHHSQQAYEQEYENIGEYFGVPDDQMQMQYQQQDMYMDPMMDQQMQYQQMPEVPPEMSEEELERQAEELRQSRSMRLKKLMLDQLNQLDAPVDVTPFRGRLDIFQRMLPFHHYTNGEEPVENFDAHFERSMGAACLRTNAIGNRIRNIVLRDSMRSSTEWEENMLRFLETENERRGLEEDKTLAEQNRLQFLNNSDILKGLLNNQINLEQTRLRVPPVPAHHHELDVQNGQLSTLYKEYEFDSNRPKDPPTAFVYEEPESESEPEEEVESKKEEVPEPISDLSPLAGFQQISPAVSPDRSRNESESTCEWKDDDESPLLSPETKAAEEIRREVFGTDEDLDKSEPFPFEQLRQKALEAHSSVPSTSDSVPSRRSPSPKPVQRLRTPSPSPIRNVPVPVAPAAFQPSTSSAPRAARDASGSPELDETFISPRPKAEEIAPIALPVPVHKIKKEKEETPKLPKLSIRVPVLAYQKGIEIAASGDEEEPSSSSSSSVREPIKLKIKLGTVKVEEPSPEKSPRPVVHLKSPARALEPKITPPKLKQLEKPVFKTPLPTPIKATTSGSGDRKRRSEKIEPSVKRNLKEVEKNVGMVTPKNGVVEERFLKTMTDGRKITMKIGPIPRHINHFVTPRRDGKGNIMKDLTPTKNTRLKMIFRRKSGKLSVEVIEKKPDVNGEPEKKKKKEDVPNGSREPQPTGRLDPASRKGSVDEKKKSTANYVNKFNPFTKIPAPSSTSVPTTPSVPQKATPVSAPKSTGGSSMLNKPTVPPTGLINKPTAPVALSTPQTIRRPAPVTAPISAPITTTPMIPKVAIPNPKIENATPDQSKAQEPKKLSAFLPWLSDNDESPEGKVKIPSASAAAGAMASTSSAPSTSSAYLTVKTEPMDPESTVSSANAQESPRATSSMSMIMFDDTGPNGFPIFNLHSPKRTNEPLPRVEFSDDEENELAHSTFSQATDHLLNTSSLNPSWSRDP